MQNFQRIAMGVDVIPLLHALQLHGDLWDEWNLRTTHPQSPHTEVSDIWLRFNDLEPYKKAEDAGDLSKLAGIVDEHESICYEAWYKLPQARDIIFNIMRRVEGVRLGRVLITRLAPGRQIPLHEDGGDHAAYYERYHVVLQNFPGSIFKCGDETVTMQAGEVWWFDNAIEHTVINNGADDRIVLIVDVRVEK